MLREIRPALVILILLTLITGLAYPLAMTAIAGVIFPKQAQGSLIEKDGKVVGSALIGQEFKGDNYFHGRPSATLAPDPNDATKTVPAPYNAANSGGSNLGPTSKALNDRVKEDVEKLKLLKGHVQKGQFVTKMRKVFTKAEMDKDLEFVRAKVGDQDDNIEYFSILPTSPP